MQASDIPSPIPAPWAHGASAPYTHVVPTASQQGITNGAASYYDGFPPLCFVPYASGGAGPFGADFNGVLNQISAGVQWAQVGASYPYSGTFQTAISGYPVGSVVGAAAGTGLAWVSLVDNNTTNPELGNPASWAPAVQIASSNRAHAGVSAVYTYAGNPNGHVAGTAATSTTPPDVCWDTTNNQIWICTTSGNAAAAIWLRPSLAKPISVSTIVATGAYSVTVPPGASTCVAQGWGAGGGGGYGSTTSNCASGGSSGAYGSVTLAVTPGSTITGTVGTGGIGSSNASAGGQGSDTTIVFGSTYTAGGGPGGLSEQNSSANSPNLASLSGPWGQSVLGQQGNVGFAISSVVISGQGGSAPLGGPGGVGGGGVPGSGMQPGGGGGGSGDAAGGGGNGGAGQVVLTFY